VLCIVLQSIDIWASGLVDVFGPLSGLRSEDTRHCLRAVSHVREDKGVGLDSSLEEIQRILVLHPFLAESHFHELLSAI
jgi:hypothetical protein